MVDACNDGGEVADAALVHVKSRDQGLKGIRDQFEFSGPGAFNEVLDVDLNLMTAYRGDVNKLSLAGVLYMWHVHCLRRTQHTHTNTHREARQPAVRLVLCDGQDD